MPDNTLQKNRLKRMLAWDKEPPLTEAEIDDLLLIFQRTDKNGLAADDENWIPTYNLSKAAAEGWRWKAAKASELISVDLDGERMSSQMVFEHCQEMVRTYSRKTNSTISVGIK